MLTLRQQIEAYNIGVARSKAARRNGSKHLVGWRMDIDQERADGYSAIAEAIVADHVGGVWLSAQINGPTPATARTWRAPTEFATASAGQTSCTAG